MLYLVESWYRWTTSGSCQFWFCVSVVRICFWCVCGSLATVLNPAATDDVEVPARATVGTHWAWHLLGTKALPGMIAGYHQQVGGQWSGDA